MAFGTFVDGRRDCKARHNRHAKKCKDDRDGAKILKRCENDRGDSRCPVWTIAQWLSGPVPRDIAMLSLRRVPHIPRYFVREDRSSPKFRGFQRGVFVRGEISIIRVVGTHVAIIHFTLNPCKNL